MMKPIRNAKLRDTLLPTLALTSLLILGADTADAQQRVQLLNGSEGVESLEAERAATPRTIRHEGVVRAMGKFEFSSRGGLRFGGQQVHVSRLTTVFPNVNGASTLVSPRDLEGRTGTIYARESRSGLTASIIILDPEEGSYDPIDVGIEIQLSEAETFIPSESDPNVGMVSAAAPE